MHLASVAHVPAPTHATVHRAQPFTSVSVSEQRSWILRLHVVCPYLSIVRNACMEFFLIRPVRWNRILIPFKMNCHCAVFIYIV